MSTLPFLLSVADELDNINSQSYMDDFGLGFHPHRQYYRTPNIQLSLPASTEWMEHEQRHQRYRSHKFYDETQNNLQTTDEADEDANSGNGGDGRDGCTHDDIDAAAASYYADNASSYMSDTYCAGGGGGGGGGGASTSARSRQRFASALNSNNDIENIGGINEDDDNIDNSVQMYNLSKKCCKNYHRHAGGDNQMPCHGREKSSNTLGGGGADGGYRLHTKCMEGNNSSSDESLQKVSSSIEFLTCFLLKKSRASKNTNTSGSGVKKS